MQARTGAARHNVCHTLYGKRRKKDDETQGLTQVIAGIIAQHQLRAYLQRHQLTLEYIDDRKSPLPIHDDRDRLLQLWSKRLDSS
jgi:hypothetical protein